MNPLIHATVCGINSAAVDHGHISWPNEKVAFEFCLKVAHDLDGPEFLTDEGLSKQSAVAIYQRLHKEASDLAAMGYGPTHGDLLLAKQAAAMDVNDRASIVAEACMAKAAEMASLTSVGPNTAESAASAEQVAGLDIHNRPVNKYLMGVGRTAFPSGGVVGQQMVHPERQAGPSISNSLTALDKQAAYERDPQHLSTMAKRILGGSGIGAALGAGGAALATEDDEDRLRNALLGGLGGAAVGAGAGYGYDRFAMGRPMGEGGPMAGGMFSARRPTENMHGLPEGMAAQGLSGFDAIAHGANVSPAMPQGRLLSSQGANLPEGYLQDAIARSRKTAAYIPKDLRVGAEAPQQHLSAMAKRILAGSGIGAALGAGGAALATEDDEDRLRNALLGGLGGAAVGAGAGYGYDRFALGRPMGEGGPMAGGGMSALRPTENMRGLPEGMAAQGLGGFDAIAHGANVSPAMPQGRLLTSQGANLPEGYLQDAIARAGKTAALDFIYALNKTAGYVPDDVGVWAAAGLAEAGTAGLQAMNDIVHSVKTAEEADYTMRTVLANQQQLGMLGSAELATEVGHIVEADLKETAKKTYDKAKGHASEGLAKMREMASRGAEKAKEYGGKAREHAGKGYEASKKYMKEHGKDMAIGAGATLAAGGLAYGAKKLYDDSDHKKKAFLLAQLKAAAEGSLTATGENTPESAAHDEQVAALDMHNRRPEEYLTGVGRTRMPNAGHIGAAMDAPKHDGVDTHNTPSDELKHAADEQYLAAFRKTAAAYGPMLPANMPKNEKIAHLQAIMGIVPDARESYIEHLYR